MSKEREWKSGGGAGAAGAAGAASAAGLRVWSVNIPGCDVGTRTFVADSGEEAFAAYKQLGGILSHVRPPEIIEVSPESSEYAAAVKAHEAAIASKQS